ncbi:hypothetical protein TanjilG_26178 [Lupinus angustifolius]|uniref:TRF2/HOY1 PH-like domain-containing protein n=1 Tax=Lupinus angustifolius TaxID=3871 RepID=A0A4P1R250_LUPAN|nr:PREDICTED: uncharacterized protein LOC109362450 [Lupinus angustifolius]OIV99840.1 hypothetical protein TanjilG_26178 [Lupinus angustifolius]
MAPPSRYKVPVKLEIEDPLEEEHGPLNKRFKPSQKEGNASNATSLSSPSQIDILDEPSPLGLRLRKSPSLLDLIQMKLSQGNTLIANAQNEGSSSGVKKESGGGASVSSRFDKLKASNFPASFLRIGSWEYKSIYEGDLVAKCYFAKHKLVWEVLEGALKSKIEIQWSDITALKANCPDNGPSSLTIVLARQPLFFRETNPQPRKHTLWQVTADFTDGQASKHRLHILQCAQGVLTKHFEKLIQCDERLHYLSRHSEIILDSPHFDAQPCVDNLKDHDLHQDSGKGSVISCFQDMGSPNSSLSPSFTIEHNGLPSISLDGLPHEAPSPSSVMDCRTIEGSSTSSETDSKIPRNWDQVNVPGLRPSISLSDLIGHIEHCLSEQITSGNPSFNGEVPEYQEMLENISQYLLNDNQVTTTSDEKSLMSRVDSLCCLLQKDTAEVQNSHDNENTIEGPHCGKDVQLSHHIFDPIQGKISTMDIKAEEDSGDVSSGKQAPGMSRKDSFGDLIFHIPRITSLSKFLFNISEEDGNSNADSFSHV